MSEDRSLLSYAWRYRRRYALGAFALLATDALELVIPCIVAVVIDSLRDQELQGVMAWIYSLTGRDYVLLASIIVVAVGIQAILRYYWRVGFVFTSQLIARDLRRDFFEKLTFLPSRFFDKSQTGDLMSRASNDVEAVRTFLGIGLLIMADTIFYFVFVPALLFSWSPSLTLCLLIILPIVPFVGHRLNLAVEDRFTAVQAQLSVISAHAQEAASGVLVVRSFAREESESGRFRGESQEYLRRTLGLWRVQMWVMPVMVAFVALEELLLIWIGGRQVVDGLITPGQFVAFFFYLVMLTWPMEGLGWVLSLLSRGRASYERLQEIFREQPEIADGPRDEQPLQSGRVTFQGVTFSYPAAARPALVGIDLELQPGKTVAIVGRLGSGKSTLARMVCRMLDPQQGRLLADGVDVREYPLADYRRAIGYVPQETFLFSASVATNVALGMPIEDRAAIQRGLELAGLADEVAALPKGLDTMLGERGINLSGGQRQRLALARAIVLGPRVLVLDDCLSAVDTRTEQKILRNLEELRRDRTTLVTSHRLTSIADADWIVVLEQGAISEQGTHADLMAKAGWYASTYARQLLERSLEEQA